MSSAAPTVRWFAWNMFGGASLFRVPPMLSTLIEAA
jgi:hypothetical protein